MVRRGQIWAISALLSEDTSVVATPGILYNKHVSLSLRNTRAHTLFAGYGHLRVSGVCAYVCGSH